MDRGLVSEANLKWLCDRGARYLMGNPKSQLKAHAAALLDRANWQRVHEGLEVKLVVGHTEDDDRFIVCRSTDRGAKEVAMLQRELGRLRVVLHKRDEAYERARRALSDNFP